jgi:hypothetical protein
MDHDQRFKALLQEFFREFLLLFFPKLAERFDLTSIDWMKTEVFPSPPQGLRQYVDLMARLRTKAAVQAMRLGEEDSLVVLVHVEIEAEDSVARLPARMFDYYVPLRRDSRLPVLPLALYLQVGKDGIGIERYVERLWDHELLHFEYFYVGLPALEAARYLHGDNWLGVALSALMRMRPEEKPRFKAEALRRLVECPESEQRRFLLCECVQAYLPLHGPVAGV